MKYLKALGLAMVSATVLMAFGAGTASANLCTETPAGGAACPIGERINVTTNSHIQVKLTHNSIFTPGNTFNPFLTCTEGAATATMTSNTTATLNSFSLMNCEGSSSPVVVKKGQLHFSDHHFHRVTMSAANTEVTFNILGVSCTYGASGASMFELGTINGSTFTVETTIKKTAGSFLCPAEAGWDLSGHFETPSAMYWINAGT